MKASYAALLSLVVAYSAYQGTGNLKSGTSQEPSRASHDSSKLLESSYAKSSGTGVEPFSTISGGICQLALDETKAAPCGDCKAICPAKELKGLIDDYFRAESGVNKQYLETHWSVPQAEQSNIQFVIASLPDPVHTHMALLFDRGIETLQSAAQASGFLFSRAWMPWDTSIHSESTDFTVRMAQSKLRESIESLPGLMIFQKSRAGGGAARTILFVFVIGETPTGGLHIEQFQNALNIRRSILAGAPSDLHEAMLLRIYGPEFSGSLRSLDAVLSAQPDNQFSKIIIRSGSVSSAQAVAEFLNSTDQESNNRPAKTKPDFATFQFSDAYQEYYLGLFFCSREHLHSHVAVLSEDETAFGNQERPTSSQKSPLTTVQSPESPDPCHGFSPESGFPFVRLYFPREIAQLRDAYQRDLKTQSAAASAPNQAPQGLVLSLSVTGNDDDSVAPYSPLQTPLSQESILQGIVASLRREHAKVVIIRAADPLDMVFLSRYLRQNYPQARLVTVGADLLMVHEFSDPRFHGILAATPYPLLTGTEFPDLSDSSSAGGHVRRLFPDSYAVGEFNAFRSLLAPNAETAAKNLLPLAGYQQFGLPSFLQPKGTTSGVKPLRAHLWLVAVGRDGYWPVAVLDDVSNKADDGQQRPKPSIRPVDANSTVAAYSVHFAIGWTIFWLLTFSLTAFFAFLLAYPDTFSRSEILGRFGGVPSRERNSLLFTAGMLLLAAQTIFVFPSIVWLGRFAAFDSRNPGEALNGMALAMLCYVASVLALGFAFYARFGQAGTGTLGRWGLAVCLVATAVVLSATAWLRFGQLDTSLGAFVYRYIHVGSGVSPALPLFFLLAAWIWWCWQSLTGITSTNEKHVVLPKTSDFDRTSPPDEESVAKKLLPEASDRVRLKALAALPGEWPWKALGTVPLEKKIILPTFAGLVIILVLMRPSEIAEAFESSTYKGIYWFLLYSCLLLVCYLVTHIVALWLQFRTLLRAIERVPFRRGFSDLKTLTWKPLWKLAGNGRQEFVQLLGDEVDALDEIQKRVPKSSRLEQTIKDTQVLMNSVSSAYEPILDGNPAKAGNYREIFYALQDRLAACASEALIYANDQWKNESSAPPLTKQDQKKDKDTDKAADATLEPTSKDPLTRSLEYFLCLFYLNIILVPLRRLQTLILAIAGVFVFVLISYSSYPFESRESFHVLLIFIFFAISLVVGIVYGQMYGNPLLSRITNTKPGELGLDFWVRLGTFVFVPLLSLLSVQFPEINSFLFSWLQPALQSIK
jgi:hypothetical protein